ncbi:MAG: flavodoxin domain-containing protein, partial [Pseudomonadota bacterium]
WVGVVDWNLRDFHGYLTEDGSTYNAYLILDEKITLIDTVKKEWVDEMFQCISHLVDPKKIDYVVSNHSEMDHSGGLPQTMHKIGEDKPLYCSKIGHKTLAAHFHRNWNFQPLENGGSLSLGRRSLTFLETRMLHWPDSMFAYCPEEKLLFSSDAFGQHYAGIERFDDEIGEAIMPQALKYYANIILLYSPLVLKLIETVKNLGLEIDIICPDHGVIWRRDPMKIIKAYAEWAEQKPVRRAVVAYDTMWQSTRRMAEAIVEALIGDKVDAKMMHLRSWHRSDIITEISRAGAVIVGSPTLNNGLFPTVADFLSYLKGLKPQNKVAAAFGSYGWSGEAVKLINREFEDMKLKVVDPGIKSLYVPDQKSLEACYELGRKVAAALPPS